MNILLNLYNFDEDWAFPFLKKIILKSMTVTIVPFSFNEKEIGSEKEWEFAYGKDTGKYYNDIVSPFRTYGIDDENIQWINYYADTHENACKKISGSDVIFFTGGYPDRMMARINEFGIARAVKTNNDIVMGSSAGAMIQLSEYFVSPDADYDRFLYYQAA